jgi:DUF4097 and DUF4098 domain-containing protein YvlB
MNRFLELRSSVLVVFSSLLIGTLAFAETKEEPTRTLTLQAGGYLSLENINGDVTIEGWKKNEVSISAVKRGKSKDLDRIKIEVDVDKYEGKDWIHIETEYLASDSGLLGFLKNAGGGIVDYTIKAPADATLEDVELVNGNLKVTGITGYLSLGTVNGSINATGIAGNAWIETVNGNLDLSFDKMGEGQSVDLDSVNGAIALRIPAKASAHVEAETLNGNITNEFGLTVDRGEWVGRSMEGVLGSGGARITIETVNGSIDIKKR